MELFSVKNLSFTYAGQTLPALRNINLDILSSEFVTVFGESGSSKTTLLKMLKPQLSPRGEQSGEIFFKGNKISELNNLESASKIGFIAQNPETQLVTDKVYSELSFGLENLGKSRESIRAEVAEFASYFGLADDFERSVNELSGGEKQLLNLASVMAMNPEVLLLDEPTSMLDPISAMKFITALKRINDELGTTVIIVEHRLSELLSISDRAVYIEDGEVKACGNVGDVCAAVKGKRIEKTLPAVVRVFNKLGLSGELPLTVRDGRKILLKNNIECKNNSDKEINTDTVLSAKNLWFRYNRSDRDVLKCFSFSLRKGEIYALLGANGSGKSTVLWALSGRVKPYRGKVRCSERLAVFPQNPRDLFVKESIEEDFKSINNSYKELCERFNLTDLLSRHPYDLSGGELQRAALVKVLLTQPQILLLDEPTKGLDFAAKEELGAFLREITDVSIVVVTHDLEFAAAFCDRCGLLFDGSITSENSARAFFTGNSFYTTQTARLTRGIVDGAVTVEDIYEA